MWNNNLFFVLVQSTTIWIPWSFSGLEIRPLSIHSKAHIWCGSKVGLWCAQQKPGPVWADLEAVKQRRFSDFFFFIFFSLLPIILAYLRRNSIPLPRYFSQTATFITSFGTLFLQVFHNKRFCILIVVICISTTEEFKKYTTCYSCQKKKTDYYQNDSLMSNRNAAEWGTRLTVFFCLCRHD